MPEQRIKTEVIRTRVTAVEKAQFVAICEKLSINQSELLRKLIKQWTAEQQDKELQKHRKTDIIPKKSA